MDWKGGMNNEWIERFRLIFFVKKKESLPKYPSRIIFMLDILNFSSTNLFFFLSFSHLFFIFFGWKYKKLLKNTKIQINLKNLTFGNEKFST